MSYQVLARKYRPRSFHDVVGQAHVVRALVHALDQDRLHHAYLFTGTRGVGKTTLARILANSLNCEMGVTSKPCAECTSCLEIAEGRFVDLIEVDAASRTRVEETRELLDNVQYMPTRGRYKVYLIDEVHMLSRSSFNALLKTLEEPPPHVVFLLATTDPKQIPMTVLSRCLQFNLKNILPEVITSHLETVLKAESVEFDEGGLAIIADAAMGSIRDALSITDQVIGFGGGEIREGDVESLLGIVRRDEIAALLDALADDDKSRLLQCAAELAERNADFKDVIAGMQRAFHDLSMAQTVGGEISPLVEPYLKRISPENVQLYYQIALMGGRDLQFAPDERIGFEMTLIRMLAFRPQVTPEGMTTSPSDSTNVSSKDVPSGAIGNEESHKESAVKEKRSSKTISDGASIVPQIAWHEVVDALKPTGLTAMVLANSQLVSRTDVRWELVLDEAHDTLIRNEKQRVVIQKLVSQFEGHEVEVLISTGRIDGETPAARRRRIDEEELNAATRVLKDDATVQSLVTEFDGRLESIRRAP